ncbi:MAG: pentapeptide repeat-containing protein [Methylococcaceae bacterium]
MSDEIQNAQEALTSANDAANVVRELYFVFLSIAVYMGVIVAGTTHEMLLKESPIKLPLLDVEVSILGFYVVAPYLFWIFHFHFLLQLYLLAQKLRLFEKYLILITDNAIKEKLRTQLANVIFSHSLIGAQHDSFMRMLLRIMVSISINVMPLILLLLVQIRFIPYHSELINDSQRLVVILDVLTLIVFLAKISGTTFSAYVINVINDVHYCYNHCLTFVIEIFTTSSLSALTTPAINFSSLVTIVLSTLVISSSFLFVVPDENCESPLNKIGNNYCRFLYGKNIYPCKKSIQDEISAFQNLTITWIILTKSDLSPEIATLLSAKEKDDNLLKNLVGLDLNQRDLNCTDFINSHFMYADLQETNFKKADLSDAHLEEADLSDAHLEEADLGGAHLEGADLSGAHLEGAVLKEAHLEGAVLKEAYLEGADLSKARLNGADLSGAHIEGTLLKSANINLVNFTNVTLILTQEHYAELQQNLKSNGINQELSNNILRLLEVDKATDLSTAKSYQDCFIGGNYDIKIHCLKDNKDYQPKLTAYFANELVCKDNVIAQAIIARANWFYDDNFNQALKKSNCPTIKTALINHPLN